MTVRIAATTLAIFAFFTPSFAQKTETRSLGSFESINIGGGYDVCILKEGSTESIEITATGIDLGKIETKVENNSLNIGTKNGSYSWNDKTKIKLVITYRSINSINNSGSTDIEVQNTLKANHFEYNTSGSGDLKADFDVAKLSIHISGSGDMTLSGRAKTQAYAISGSGDINAVKMPGDNASVAISGSGDVNLNISGHVSTSISGSGDVNNQNKD